MPDPLIVDGCQAQWDKRTVMVRYAFVTVALAMLACDHRTASSPTVTAATATEGFLASASTATTTGTSSTGAIDESTAESAGTQYTACAELIACVRDSMPTPITPLIETYGPDGSCWERHATQDCESDCATLAMGFACGVIVKGTLALPTSLEVMLEDDVAILTLPLSVRLPSVSREVMQTVWETKLSFAFTDWNTEAVMGTDDAIWVEGKPNAAHEITWRADDATLQLILANQAGTGAFFNIGASYAMVLTLTDNPYVETVPVQNIDVVIVDE